MEIPDVLLARQIRQYLGDQYQIDEKLQNLLAAVSQSYLTLANEARYQQIVESATDLIYTFDALGYFTYANPVACHTFGYTQAEVCALHFTQVIAPEHREMARTFYKRQFDERIADTYLEFKYLTRNGQISWFGHNVHLQLDATHNQIVGLHGVARDITKAKQAEESAKIREHLLSVMSHETRTPLNAVIGLSHLLLDENPLPSQAQHLKSIRYSADNLLTIINNIVDFSKIESDKIIFEKIEFRLEEVFKNIEKSMAPKASDSNLQLLLSFDQRLPTSLVGDASRLNQILLNLISNAIRFTEKGIVEVKAQEVSRTRETVTVEFKVTDTGIGIASDQLPAIFNNFSQTAGTPYKSGGTGLGLAITKRLVELQGGMIQVRSKVGAGSAFTVLLTFSVPVVRALRKPITDVISAKPLKDELNDLRLLLVEDNRMNQLVVKKFLEKWGVRMQIAENGIEAIEKLRENVFDIVLMDLQMPRMDGYNTARYIRHSLETPVRNIPIVALTASSMNDVRRKVVEAGMNDFITKPFDPRDLYLKILKYTQPLNHSEQDTWPPSSGTSDTSGYINLQYLEEISTDNTDFIIDMIRLFLRQMPQFVDKLKRACNYARWADIRYITHKMKSSLATIGIFELESVMRQLETCAAQENNLTEAEQLSNHIGRICEEVYKELHEKLAQLQPELVPPSANTNGKKSEL